MMPDIAINPNNLFVGLLRFALLLMLWFAANRVQAQQSTCTNADFEQGNFTDWQGQIGNCCPIDTFTQGIFPDQHTIVTGAGTDPNTCDNLTIVAPGGVFSARLGNDQTGAKAEKLSYTLNVTAATSLFIYKYAVVLQDPGHTPDEQPRFDVRVVDSNNVFLDPDCASFSVVAGPNMPGFQSCIPGVWYRDWETIGLNLTDYIGQTVTVEFMTGDCSVGGHYGYAYIDAYCSTMELQTAYCVGSSGALLTAPIGFEYLWSTGETTQSITIQNPQQGAVYSCVLTAPTGCQVTTYATIDFNDPIADFNLANTCFDNAVFIDSSQTFNSAFSDYQWDFGDGTTSSDRSPVHAFPAPGTYTVIFSMSNALGCIRSVTKTVTVYQTPAASIVYPAGTYCNLTTTPQPVTLTGTGIYTGGTFTASPAGLSLNPVTGAIIPSLSSYGSYVVTYTLQNLNGCIIDPVTANVQIDNSPTAAISYQSSVFCQSTQSTFENVVLSGTGAFSGGFFTSTPAGLSLNSSTGAIDVGNSQPGSYTVSYTLISLNACADYVTSTTIRILSASLPVASLSDGLICVDDAGSTISAYTFTIGLNNSGYDFQWFLNNNPISGAQSNTYTASVPGDYAVVVTNTITGCTSAPIHANLGVIALVEDFAIIIEEEFRDNDVVIQVINGSGNYLYQLDDGAQQQSNLFYDVAPGMHSAQVTDSVNCTNVTKTFYVLGYPKFFTPNGDGINDFWKIDSGNFIRGTISIYDRFGKLIYTMRENQRGWDGTYLGSRVPATDYWFVVKYRHLNSNGEEKTFRSHFSLKR